jgi:hypothetical protein
MIWTSRNDIAGSRHKGSDITSYLIKDIKGLDMLWI